MSKHQVTNQGSAGFLKGELIRKPLGTLIRSCHLHVALCGMGIASKELLNYSHTNRSVAPTFYAVVPCWVGM